MDSSDEHLSGDNYRQNMKRGGRSQLLMFSFRIGKKGAERMN